MGRRRALQCLMPASATALLAAQFTPDPRIPATAYGFGHLMWHGHRLVYRDGTLGDQHGTLILVPEDRLGIFIASNSLPGLGDFLYAPMMTHLFGDADPPLPALAPRPGASERAARLAGAYRDYHHTRSDMSRVRALMPMIQARLTVDGDGALRWQGRRWLEVEPSVFRREDAHEYIVFRTGERGEAELHSGNGTYERIGWLEQTAFHGVLLVACVVAFLAYAGFRLVALVRRARGAAGRAERTPDGGVRRRHQPGVPGRARTFAAQPRRHHAAALADDGRAVAAAPQRRRHGTAARLRRACVDGRLVDAP